MPPLRASDKERVSRRCRYGADPQRGMPRCYRGSPCGAALAVVAIAALPGLARPNADAPKRFSSPGAH